ncbi:MAG TPA: flagellar basal body-associated FliL family protein [Acidimicrobiia bacterium]|jgi:flagellar FliL protein|nr:flagellar basal body-associated FliL family protein [Acidimicrobiia bacterium]
MAKKKTADGDEAKSGKGKTVAMGAVMAIGLLGGLKGFVLSGGKAAAATGVSTTSTTKPGPIVTLDPITVNIAGDRFLKIGLGLQLSGKLAGQPAPKDSNDPTKGFARALDLTIETFGGHTYDSLVTPAGRTVAKEELIKKLEAAYPEEVEGVYFTDFVMQ